ncbi:hypothetical protein BSFP_020070 [Burkholderia stabilis]|uniref:Uncharacterized protein n=1 Tax=Burkholderia stabilis TaxID=95485 RepID=A0A1Y1BJ86_9BURK|nr:hypothetical protein BSFP_020070 [Burkholderia stabilis]
MWLNKYTSQQKTLLLSDNYLPFEKLPQDHEYIEDYISIQTIISIPILPFFHKCDKIPDIEQPILLLIGV